MRCSQYYYYYLLLLLLLSLGFFAALQAENQQYDPQNRLLPENYERSRVLSDSAMPELYDSKLGKLLMRYYNEGLGGIEQWAQVKSIKMKGTIVTEDGQWDYESIAKKPNMLKIRIFKYREELEITTNGAQVWRKSPTQTEAVRVDPDSALAKEIIHDSVFSSLLLFPFETGKTISYLGTEREEGQLCHIIRVELKEGFSLDYFIDVQSYKEIKVIQKNDDLGPNGSTIVFSDYREVGGLQLPFKVTTLKGGQQHSFLHIDVATLNVGAMEWMFNLGTEF